MLSQRTQLAARQLPALSGFYWGGRVLRGALAVAARLRRARHPSIRRECLGPCDRRERGRIARLVAGYIASYMCLRTHLTVAKDSPSASALASAGALVVTPQVVRLHHRQERIAA